MSDDRADWLVEFVEISDDVVAFVIARMRAPNNQSDDELTATADRLSRWIVDPERADLIRRARKEGRAEPTK